MKSLFVKLSLLVVLALVVSPPPIVAQSNTITKTTLSAAITSAQGSANQVTIASATGVSASSGTLGQRYIMVDRELMEVKAVNSTTLTVLRARGNTTATKHASGSLVIYGPFGLFDPGTGNTSGVFLASPPIEGTPCTLASQDYSSVYNANAGTEHICLGSLWRTIATPPGLQGLNTIVICGDLPNNTTNFLGAALGFPAGTGHDAGLTANDLGFSLTGTGCDGLDSTTEATADTVMYANNAMRVLGMTCTVGSSGSNGITLNFRADAASLTPDLTMTIPTSSTTGTAWLSNPAVVAANKPIAIRAISTENLSASNGWCTAQVQVLP